jgi:hypothetical protein
MLSFTKLVVKMTSYIMEQRMFIASRQFVVIPFVPDLQCNMGPMSVICIFVSESSEHISINFVSVVCTKSCWENLVLSIAVQCIEALIKLYSYCYCEKMVK